MGRSPCCSKEGLNRGAWTAHEDKILRDFISLHGEGRWRNLPKRAGLKRCGKSCRLRWLNYLRPDIKRGNITPDEEELIVRLHKLLGNRWSLIAGRLPGRTDNEIKNYWNTNLGKKLKHQNINVAPSAQPKTTLTDITPKNEADTKSNPLFNNIVRTKATKCSKVIITTPPPSNPQVEPPCHHQPAAAVAEGGNRTATDSLGAFDEEDNHHHHHHHHHHHGDFLMADFNVGEICLSDLLNSDFSDMCDFSNNSVDGGGLSPSSDQPFLFSDEALNDWTHSNVGDTNVDNDNLHSLTSFLESSAEWLAS